MSIGHILSLVSIIVAINASSLVLILWVVERNKKKVYNDIDNIETQTRFINNIVNTLISCIEGQTSKNMFIEGLITRLFYQYINDEIFLKNLKEELLKFNSNIKKTNYELMLYSNDKVKKISSFQQLSQSLGDIYSYDLMNEIIRYDKSEDELLLKYIEHLRDRLSTK